MTTLTLIKRTTDFAPLVPLPAQLHLVNLVKTPYESLHAVVRCGVNLWFDAFVGTRARAGKDEGAGGGGGEAKLGIPMTKTKFAELEFVAFTAECGHSGDQFGCSSCYSTGC